MGPTSKLYEQATGPLAIIGPGAADWLGVPITVDGHVRGALVVQSYEQGGLYSAVERDLLTYVGTHIVTAIDRKRAFERLEQQTRELERQIGVRELIEQRLQHEVLHDPLTGLPNRAYLREHLSRAMATQARDPSQRFAVLFLDLDRFKVINDSAGHVVGDELLKVVAQRFSDCLRPPDIVARLGGDEFAIVMHGIEGGDTPVRLAQRLIDAMREPIRVQDKQLFSGVSVGIALGSPAYAAPEELLRDADIAMYRVKERARGGFDMFDEQLHRQALELLALESELRHAVSRGEFLPHFQPILRLGDGAVVGYEALMRWEHPTRGLLAPGAFLRVAEASGVLEALDWQLYDAVFRVLPSLLRDHQYVNLNLSPRHFLVHDLDARLLALMRGHGVRPAQVRIEITEGALIDNPDRVGACIDRLRMAGVYTALDDFGTGYSSLGYLHRFRFHTIKLDRSFITDLVPGGVTVASAVVRAVIELSRALDLDVIAEGIETPAQRDAVRSLGCTFGQGYLFARPAPAAAFATFEGAAAC
jgi:diguanylate cyclase (GGDEF)-like protein